jgi:glycine cleavage system H protein
VARKIKRRSTEPTRREFLRNIGFIVSGAVISSVISGSSCNHPPFTKENSFSKEKAYYFPPSSMPPLVDVPGCEFKVATDRLYSFEHIWVLPTSNNTAVLGISEKLIAFLEGPYAIALPTLGQECQFGEPFGHIEGFKTFIDLISPVNGEIIAIDNELIAQQKPFSEQDAEGEPIWSLENDTYRSGWLAMIQVNNSDELGSLLTAEQYIALNAK